MMFPKKGICEEEKLYFIGEKYDCNEKRIKLQKDGFFSTDTYFNSFSIGKWKKYTDIKELEAVIDVEGICDIYLCYAWIDRSNVIRRYGDDKIFYSKPNEEREILKLTFPEKPEGVIAYLKVVARTGDTRVFDIQYSSSVKPLNEVKLVLGICTFRREEFIKKNLNNISTNIINNKSSNLYGKLDVLISDNGQTLENTVATNNIRLFQNLNLGGSGGFTRCLIEAKRAEQKDGYTHIILMDDDIVFDAAVLERTYTFLTLLKGEHNQAMVGGGMLVLNEQFQQFENGAEYCQGMLRFKNKNIDLRAIRNVIQNEFENTNNYNAWCYCCMPLSKITLDNLPMPFFIHMDDVEYGVRNKFEVISLNGISVWHPFFTNQRPASIVYYDVRNKLITMAELGGRHIKEYANFYLGVFQKYIFNYDYERTMIACKAIEDFCKGIDEFKNMDPLELQTSLYKRNVKWVDADESIIVQIDNSASREMISRKGLLLNYLLPSKSKQIVVDCDLSEAYPFRVKQLVVYNRATNKYCIYKKSIIKLLKAKLACKRVRRIIQNKILPVNWEWKDRINEITDIGFWESYLKIKGEKVNGR